MIPQLFSELQLTHPRGACFWFLPALGEDLHEVVGQVASGQVETQDGVGQGVTLVDGDGVGDAVAGVEHDTGGTTRGVQGQHGLDGNVPKQGKWSRDLFFFQIYGPSLVFFEISFHFVIL